MEIKLIIRIVLILFHITEIKGSDTKWIESLKESIKTDGHIYQVVFILDKSIEKSIAYNPIFKEILKELSSSIPVQKIVLLDSETPQGPDFIIYNPLFVLVNSGNNSEITRTFDFLTRLSESKRRPKCLLLLVKGLPNYRQFFEKLWSEQFLDVTAIEIGKDEAALNNGKEDYKVIQYNPFLDLITNNSASLETIWFPDKLKNLHGYPLVASLLHSPPDVFIPKNKSEKLFGFAIKKLEVMKEVLNFTIVVSSTDKWGRFECTKERSSGVVKDLLTNKIQIVGMELGVGFCSRKSNEISKGLREIPFGLIVPLISENAKSLTLAWQVPNMALLMLLPLFIWIVSRLMHFNKKKWKIDYMIRINLGTSVPEEPERTSERIIFLAFLLACFMFSSDIHTSITSVQLQENTKFKYETLEDIVSSNLQILINENRFLAMQNTADPVVRQIVWKANLTDLKQEECLELLLKYKNVSCMLEIPRAKLFLLNRRDECGQSPVKIFTDNFATSTGATLLGAGVPYTKRFDQILQRIIESGISKKWMEPYSTKKICSVKVDETSSSRNFKSVLTIQQLIFVMISGFFCSFCVFILELLTYRLRKWKRLSKITYVHKVSSV